MKAAQGLGKYFVIAQLFSCLALPAANRREIDTIVRLQLDGPVGTVPGPDAKDPP
jgi:hypothetical protein